MKISFNKKLAANTSTLIEGRHVGTIIQIAGLGDQPGFNHDDPPSLSIGVVVQVGECQIAKQIRISDNPRSTLFGYLDATLPDPDTFEGDEPLPLTLGRPVAVEVTTKGKFSNIASFHRLEEWELKDVPAVEPANLLFIESIEDIKGEEGKALFLKLHRDIRSWMSRRVRG